MVRALGGGRSALLERGGGAGVGGEPPAAARRRVDGAAHERMTEDEAPRDLGRSHEVARQQLVERVEAGARLQLRDRGRHVRLERLSGDGGPVEQRARRLRQRLELFAERCGHGGRHAAETLLVRVAAQRHGQRALLARPLQLLEVERVAAGVVADLRADGRLEPAQQLHRLGLVERLQCQARDVGDGQGGEQSLGHLPGPEAECDQHGRLRPAPQQRGDQLDRRAVAPVQVVEHEHERLVLG